MKMIRWQSIITLIASLLLLSVTACSKDNVVNALELNHERASSLEVGHCFNDTSDNYGDMSTVPIIDCNDTHDHEVYYTYQLTDSKFPEYDSQEEEAIYDKCDEEYAKYIGITVDESIYDVGIITPTKSSWEKGDREITCYVFNPRYDGKLRGSVAGKNL